MLKKCEATPQGILRENINSSMEKLRGRLFNLVDAQYYLDEKTSGIGVSIKNPKEAMKSLIKDFTQEFWNEVSKEITIQFNKK